MDAIYARTIIKAIRSDNAAPDSDLWSRADSTTVSALTSLRKNLENASHSLSEDLYSSDSHFVLELVQNADDNVYGADITPSLQMSLDLNSNTLVVACNETGFNKSQVEAICKIGASTKKHQEGYIGDKGIGFKSVFKVADKVSISSGPYTFFFDKRAELGMITPSWDDDCRGREGWTQFTLCLSNAIDKGQLKLYLSDVDPTLLIFLRKLRHLDIDLHDASFAVQRIDLGSGLIRLDRHDRNTGFILTSQYLLVKRLVAASVGEKKRPNILQTEIVLAFPVESDGSPKIHPQAVHAFLPIRNYGFSFLIQGDFLALANREDVLADSLWNITIRDGLVSVFLDAIEEFRRRPELALVWYRYIPIRVPGSFFSLFGNNLLAELRTMAILRSFDGVLRRPSCHRVVGIYVDHNGAPLIEERYIPCCYLSPDYDVTDQYSSILYELGVENLSEAEFMQGLSSMKHVFRNQIASWHEAVATQLRSLGGQHRDRIRSLPLVPLQDGSWAPLRSGDLLFSSDVIDVPDDLGLRLVAADPAVVSRKILHLHRSSLPSTSTALSHAHFLFAHRDQQGYLNLRPLPLRVLSGDGNLAKASDLYMDDGDPAIMPLSQIISSPSYFIHQDYLYPPALSSGNYWRTWLTDVLGVNLSPRVIEGQVSLEFLQFLTNPDSGSNQILRALRDYWPKLRVRMSAANVRALGEKIPIACQDGTSYRLSATALRRTPLKTFSHLHFLLLDNPDHNSWNFLEELGVTVRPNAGLYLKWLRRLSRTNSDDARVITEIYKQLSARFNEDDNASAIKAAFDSEDALIFIPSERPTEEAGRWLAISTVVWGGPPSMISKVDLQRSYPQLSTFFRTQLCILDCPNDILLQELIALTRTGSVISVDAHEHLSHILEDISRVIYQSVVAKADNPAWISQLTSHRIFPVRVASTNALELRRLEEKFYIPDENGFFFGIFRDEVDVLELHEKVPLYSIRELLQNIRQLGSRYLDVAVSCTSSPIGKPIEDIKIQQSYLLRAPLVERMLNKNLTSRPKAELLEKIHNLAIFVVESILSTYSVDNLTHSHRQELIIEEETDRFVVSISRGCTPDNRNLLFGKQLAVKLGLDRHQLLVVMSTPLNFASIYLDGEGYEHQAEEWTQDTDDSWASNKAFARVEATESGRKTTRPRRKDASIASVSGSVDSHVSLAGLPDAATLIAPVSASVDSYVPLAGLPDAASLIQLNMQSISDSAAQQTLVLAPNFNFSFASLGTQNIGTDTERNTLISVQENHERGIASSYMSPPTGATGALPSIEITNSLDGSTSIPRISGTQATSAQLLNGVLGEYFIFEILQKSLPNFALDNWTSELRGNMPGFSPYNSSSVADFRYSDTAGVLTRLLFGDVVRQKWAARWPEYHIEIKSTSDSRSEAFHMSAHQLQTASHFTLPAQGIPAAVYVLVRVWNVRSTSRSYSMHPDPHRLFYTGGVKIVSDVQAALVSDKSESTST
ncbi:hypothetical protein C8F04DRAFT_645308 [Mycena alexandri]|uniref:Sacsin/Nov domain-containing protein n=1 Tax=Mycena alexandri TaxID=1745969 RepID=A0AAD6X5D8_9AGAR|nr:hypothetical protein C8F04DRAFT_645308 [Mycena alexandri]